MRLLNEYLGEMTDVIFNNLGTLDKYIGDAIMAFWGSPYPQRRPCASRLPLCPRRCFATLDKLKLKWQSEGRKEISIGIGLNTGPVNVGNMGSAKRLAWTVMGDNVNLASRLEGMTKQYRTRIVISEGTYQQVAEHFVCRELDRIRVKGKHQPVVVYELMDVVAPDRNTRRSSPASRAPCRRITSRTGAMRPAGSESFSHHFPKTVQPKSSCSAPWNSWKLPRNRLGRGVRDEEQVGENRMTSTPLEGYELHSCNLCRTLQDCHPDRSEAKWRDLVFRVVGFANPTLSFLEKAFESQADQTLQANRSG